MQGRARSECQSASLRHQRVPRFPKSFGSAASAVATRSRHRFHPPPRLRGHPSRRPESAPARGCGGHEGKAESSIKVPEAWPGSRMLASRKPPPILWYPSLRPLAILRTRKARFGNPPGVLEARFFPAFPALAPLDGHPPGSLIRSLWPARWRWVPRSRGTTKE